LEPIASDDEKKWRRWCISSKLKLATKLIRALKCDDLNGFPEDLEEAVKLFEQRNEFVHGCIYAGHDRVDYIKGRRAVAPTKVITSAELYALANEFWDYRNHFNGLRLFKLPQAMQRFRNGQLNSE
jgi:hypothetical protein